MNIGLGGIDKISSEYVLKDLKRVKNTENKVDNYSSEDSVEISSQALDLRKMQSQAMSSSEIRQEKIAAIKSQIDNGTYQISHEKVAERLLEEHLLE